jgi:hypothetical protein
MTLFFSRKKPLEIRLFTDNPAVFDFCRPQKAAHFVPHWWKKLPKRLVVDGGNLRSTKGKATMKTCPGFIDLYANGFIQPLWSDLRVDITPDGVFHYQYADNLSSAEGHAKSQMTGSSIAQTHTVLTLESPWLAQTESDVKFLVTPPVWNDFGIEHVCVPPGVLSFKQPLPLNVNLFFKQHHETVTYELNFGQPIAHFVPLSDRPIKIIHELVSKEERERISRRSGLYFFFGNRMRKAAKLCPYG